MGELAAACAGLAAACAVYALLLGRDGGGAAAPAPDGRAKALRRLKDRAALQKGDSPARRDMRARLAAAGLPERPALLHALGLAAGALAFAVALARLDPPTAAALAFCVGLGAPRLVVDALARRRRRRFRDRFADAIEAVMRAKRGGLSLEQGLRRAANVAGAPVGGELARLVGEIEAGAPFQTALDRFLRRAPMPETRSFALAIALERETGGSSAQALAQLSAMLRARERMEGKLAASVAESRASAGIVGALPVAMAAALEASAPGYLAPLFSDPRGKALLAGALGWAAIGALLMRAMTRSAKGE